MLRRRNLSLALTPLLAILLTSVTLAGANAQASTTVTQGSFDFTGVLFVPCANGGAGEDVAFTGTVYFLITTTIDARGGVHLDALFHPRGDVRGVGAITGDIYVFVGETRFSSNTKVGSTNTFVNNFKAIAPGPGNNFYVHENVEITVNANGTVTAIVDNATVT